MIVESSNKVSNIKSSRKINQDTYIASRVILILLILAIFSSFIGIVNAGERGVLMKFGKVQENVLGEGIHLIIPIVNTVQKISVRVQKQEISAEASSKDLQEIFTDAVINWHIIPEKANVVFQKVGDETAVVERIINPAVEEVIKAVIAKYTAEEIITKRAEVKAGVDEFLTTRLATYHIAVDDTSLVHIHFSERFSDAVEAKQIAEQEAKRAGFMALKAVREAEAKVNLAKGEAEAQRLLSETLNPELLHKQSIERWDGKLPLIVGNDGTNLLDLSRIMKMN